MNVYEQTRGCKNSHNTVYLNVKNLDCVEVSDIDVDETDKGVVVLAA